MIKKLLIIIPVILILGVMAGCQSTAPNFAEVPAGKAYVNGETIYFTHTEASDQGVADLLTKMMKSPVVFVPSLADAPESMLAKVYVFKNGVAGSGPLSFQADVFDNSPAESGYSPLRQIIFVTWKDGVETKELKSLDEILSLESQGSLTLEKSDVVVNMPFITWKGGKR
ncbi:MAG: hypothetical protein LWX83_12255 [Anaerolineae bacterium]|nr:hypothetical protein [Anaerolineae bacterium]